MSSWKPQEFTRDDRLYVANEILENLITKYGERLISVAIEGSTAKGIDRPQSDLELRVVVDGRESEWCPFFYKGMFVGISFNTVEKIHSKARNIDYEWCVKGDVLFTCKIIYDPTNLYDSLKKLALETESHANYNLLMKDALADMYEHVYKIFTLRDSDIIIAAHEARQVAYWATILVGLKNNHKYLSSRSMYEEAFKLLSLPNNYEINIQEVLSLHTNVLKLKRFVGDLWSSTAEWAKMHGISLEEDRLNFL
ncbi:MAG: kanamycin nucleotidyltransferase C-terminal domain-containing protein [Bacillota bacterium]